MADEQATKLAEQWIRVKEVEADFKRKRAIVKSAIEHAFECQAAFEVASAGLSYEAQKLEALLDEPQP